jgi:hypothetical protein
MMTDTPLQQPEDFKILLKEGIIKICPPAHVTREYDSLQFVTAKGEPGTHGSYLLIGLSTRSLTHLRLRDILLSQPGFFAEPQYTVLPWLAPPFLPPTTSDVMETPRDQRTPQEIASYLKARFRPQPQKGKGPTEVRWITTCLTDEPTEETAPRFADWEGSCTLQVAIDVLTHGNGVRHSGFEGQSLETARGLLVVTACALRLLQRTGRAPAGIDQDTISDLADAFSFCDIRKRSLLTRFCTVLCDSVSD